MCRDGLANHLADRAERPRQITLEQSRPSFGEPALPSGEPVTDRVGNLESFPGGYYRRDRVAGCHRRHHLPAENLAQPPRIAQFPGKAGRLGEVRPGHLSVVRSIRPACKQRTNQQRRIVKFARHGQRPLGFIDAAGQTDRGQQHSLIRIRSHAHRGCHLRVLRIHIGEPHLQPGQPFADAAPAQPQRLQRRRRANACPMSPVSRLHPNAARRLSISISACSTRCS